MSKQSAKAKTELPDKKGSSAVSVGGQTESKTGTDAKSPSSRTPSASNKASSTAAAQVETARTPSAGQQPKQTSARTRNLSAKATATTPDGGPERSKSPRASSRNEDRVVSGRGSTKKKAKKSKAVKAGEPSNAFEALEKLPEGAVPIFLSSKTQEIFNLRADDDVTVEKPTRLIPKEEIMLDLFNRAAVSDFHPIKALITDYPGDQILVVYDPDFKYGQNFFVATTEEAKELLQQTSPDDEEEEEEFDDELDEEYTPYAPPIPKEWVSLGSEIEIEEEAIVEHRKKIVVTVKRVRREFGAPTNFSDRNAADVKDGYVECAPYEDKAFDLKRMELDKGIQAVPTLIEASMQTNWKYPKNAAVQCKPREFTKEQIAAIEKSPELADFVKAVAPRLELALQQNEILDVFYDDWAALSIDDGSFGSKADNHLKEFQSFTDLQFSKERTITCIDWHPTAKGVIAVAVGERMTFDDRVDNAAKIIMTPSLILVWSFADPIHPQLLLEAPEDIVCFKFCPTDPNIVAGGCISGQVVLWDISQYSDRLKQSRSNQTKDSFSLPGFEVENALQTPIVRYAAVSSIEHSHTAPITDIQWLPDHMELTRMGLPQENKSGQCCQILTCATDQSIVVWDIRPPKAHKPPADEKKNLTGIPTTFKHLDLTWKPHLKVTLSRNEPGGDYAPTKISISEVQGDRSALAPDDDRISSGIKLSDTAAGEFSSGALKSGASSASGATMSGAKRTLKRVQTMFYAGTEDGELLYVDWMPQKDHESGKIQTPKPEFCHAVHDGPIITVQRSPFMKGVILCVGGWTFSIWKEGVTSSPILRSAACNRRLTAGHWSPSRPSVFFISRQDGSIDIWDLLDRTHEPCMNQSISPVAITSLYPFQVTSKQHLLAVGDAIGTLHILAIPWSLRQPTQNEHISMANYIEREVNRRSFVMQRWDFREKEKMEMELEAKKKAGIAPQVVLTDEELEHRMKLEYQAYLDEELIFLRQMGLLKEDSPGVGGAAVEQTAAA